jgi:hypothetical protein
MFELSESIPVLDKAEKAWYDLQAGLAENKTPCLGKAEDYADYSSFKSADEAEEMCYGCPLIKQCYDFAVLNEVNAGIWGGIVMDEGGSVLFDVI